MAETVGWAVLGAGGIARRRTIPEGIIPAPNAELVCVYDANQDTNAAVADEFGVPAAENMDELLRCEAQVVYIATPASLHALHVRQCADAGKHVLCEKPLGLTVAEGEQMVARCADKGVFLGTAFMMRFSAQHREALRLIEEGRLGRLVYGRAQLSCWYPPMDGAWRQDPSLGGGGSLMDMGGHCIDLLEMYMGEVTSVWCHTARLIHDYASEDSAVVHLRFESGAMATVDSFFCIPDSSSRNALELYGSKGSIIASGTVGQNAEGVMTAYLEGGDAGYDAQQQRSDQQSISIAPDAVNTYQAEIEEFSSALIDGREPRNGWQAGLRSQKILAACYESARTGSPVPLS